MQTPEKKGLRKRLNDSIFEESEFRAMAEDWEQKKWITPEDLSMLQELLKKEEVKKLIETWIQIFPASIGITYFRETGSVGAGLASKSIWTGLGTYFSTLLIQSTVMATIAKKRLKGLPSAKVVPWMYFMPVIGDFAPLIYLSRKHPQFLRLLWAYRASKDTWRKQHDQPNNSSLQKHIYGQIEAKKFQKGLKNIDKILNWTQKFWDRIDTVIKKKDNQSPTPPSKS